MNESLPNSASDSYDPAFFELLNSIEDCHFWFRARKHVIHALVARIASDMTPGYLALEVGCGTGNILQALETACTHGTVIGSDLFSQGLHYARQRQASPLIQADIGHLPFRRRFGLIGCFDVLEHLPDDFRALEEIRTVLTPDGVLVMTVPAHPSLWSYFDEASGHCRRYGLAELEAKLSSTGYKVEYLTHFMMTIFPLIWLRRRLNSPDRSSSRAHTAQVSHLAQGELRVVPVVNNLLSFLLFQEARFILHHRRLPLGTSLLAVARRNDRAVG